MAKIFYSSAYLYYLYWRFICVHLVHEEENGGK